MGKINRHIEIVSSTIPSLSSMSKVSREAALKTLGKHYEHVGITMVDTMSDLETLAAASPDLVFLGMKFIPKNPSLGINDTNKIWLADYLAERGIATTGSQSISHRLELSKPLAKKCIAYAGLKTSEHFVAKMGHPPTVAQISLPYPLFVKPANRGGGLGIDADSIVHTFEQLKRKVDSIAKKLNSDSLIERYLPGREFSVAILKDLDSQKYLTMPIELIAPANQEGARLLGGSAKSSNAEKVQAVTDTALHTAVTELALGAFRTLGGRDYGRIDIRLDESGEPHFLEANLLPSLIDNYGSFPKACALNKGIDYESMLLQIVDLGMARSQPAYQIAAANTYTNTVFGSLAT